MKTFTPTPKDIRRDWYVVNAEDKILGRLATEIARRLHGKHKPEFTPFIDTGDFIVVVNAEKLKVTGKKLEQKKYYRHSGFPGGLKETSLKDMLDRHPERVLLHAVKGMLPRNRMGRALLKKLKVYAGTDHPHGAQQPAVLDI